MEDINIDNASVEASSANAAGIGPAGEGPAGARKKSAGDSIEPRLSGLLPVGVFLLLFIGSGVVLNDFYSMPAIVAFVCALAVAFIQNP